MLAAGSAGAESRPGSPPGPSPEARPHGDRVEDWDLRVGASAGFEYFRGDYGELDLDESMAVPLGLALDWGPFSLGVTLPVRRAEVDSVRCTTTRPFLLRACRRHVDDRPVLFLLSGLARVETSDAWGVGDLQLDLSATWIPETDRPWLPGLAPFAALKLPSGDVDQLLGTGSVDTTVGLDASWLLGDTLLPFVSGSYTFVDDREELGLLGFAAASAGATWAPLERAGATLAYEWRDRAAEGEDDAHQLSPSLWIRLGEHVTFEPYGVVGLSPSAPDFGIGARFRVSR